MIPRELEDIGLESTPQYDPYEDKTQNENSFPQLAEKREPMPEVGNHYRGGEILLPRGGQMVRGHVVARSQDANGNVIRRSHTNPMLDSRIYQVEFTGSEVTELTANVIAKSLYTKCHADGSTYPGCANWLSKGQQGTFPNRSANNSSGQISNPKVHCRLANLLPVEGLFYLMGDVV